jgi:positive regulator of sigma E activity
MKDRGFVVSSEKGFAQVEVDCLEACKGCSAKSLCTGNDKSKGTLSVRNPIKARSGDEVKIDVPERTYNLGLIIIFGTLLASSLLGMFIGVFLSEIFSFPSPESGLVGLFSGLFLGGTGLVLFFPKKNKEGFYPIITDIINEGDHHA